MDYPFFPYTAKAAQEEGIEDVSEINRNCGFATRLRELRNGAKISQAELAKSLGIVKSTLGLYETGDTVPDARTLCAIARYFGVSSDWLLGLSKNPTPDINENAFLEKCGIDAETYNTLCELYTDKDDRGVMPAGFLEDMAMTPQKLVNEIIKSDFFFNSAVEFSAALNSFLCAPILTFFETVEVRRQSPTGYEIITTKEFAQLKLQQAQETLKHALRDIWDKTCERYNIDPHREVYFAKDKSEEADNA